MPRSFKLLLRVLDLHSAAMARVVRLTAPPFRLAARWWRLSMLRASVRGRVPVSTQFDGPVHTAGAVRLELGDHCRLGRGVFLETCEEGRILIGSDVRINTGTFIVSYSEVSIGRRCLIGEYVSIRDADHGAARDQPIREQAHQTLPIRIGEDVWIGRGVAILKGVKIGDGAVIAANSVVTKDVPPLMIVAGVPARELRERTASGAGLASPAPAPAKEKDAV